MAEAYCPRCRRPMSGGLGICPECAEELNKQTLKSNRMMSLIFSFAVLLTIFFLFRSGRLGGVLKIFTTLKLLAMTAEEYISKLI